MKKSISKTFITILCINFLFFTFLLNLSCRNEQAERAAWTKAKTVAGFNREFGEPFGIAVKDGEIFVSDGETGKILRVLKDGRTEIFAEGFDTPSQIAFDQNGILYAADSGTHTIKKINQNGIVELVAGIENQAGLQDGNAGSALFNAPVGIAAADGKIYVADTYNDRIRVIENGIVSTLAGTEKGFADGIGTLAKFDTPLGLAIWKNGKILVADAGNRRIRVIEPDTAVKTLAGNGNVNVTGGLLSDAEFVLPTAIAVDERGAVYVADGNAIRAIGRHIFPFVETISDERRGFTDGNFPKARFNRPSGLAVDERGNLLVADSDNQAVRIFTGEDFGTEISVEQKKNLRFTAEEFRALAAPRWMYDPPEKTREIAGTLGEIRGEIIDKNSVAFFHNGLDIAGGYGETARFIRDEKVLNPFAAQNFGTLRELLRMPTLGYIHIRLGRDRDNKIFGDNRFQFSRDRSGKLNGIRIPRGAKFKAGEAVGTLNSMNHVHLIAGRSGAEMNALDALVLPGASDSRPPTIEKITLFDKNWRGIETEVQNSRIKLDGKTRIVVRAFDQMDGNAARRRLGLYRLGYQILKNGEPLFQTKWTLSFEKMPDTEAVPFVYANGSRSGAAGETIFNYIVTNEVDGDSFSENFFDTAGLENGEYILRVFAADFFGNTASKDLTFEVIK